jgi:hypothetical protein
MSIYIRNQRGNKEAAIGLCHFEQSGAERNDVEESLIISSLFLRNSKRCLHPFDFAQGKTFGRHDGRSIGALGAGYLVST